jgi:hypothetical protein
LKINRELRDSGDGELVRLANNQYRKNNEFERILKEKLGITIFDDDDISKLRVIEQYILANFNTLEDMSYFIASNNISI